MNLFLGREPWTKILKRGAKEKAEIMYKYIYEETAEYVEGHNLTFTLDRDIQKQLNSLTLDDLNGTDDDDE